jgi:hypothetical protein
VWKKLAELPAISSQFVSLEVIVEDHTKHRRPLIPTHSKLFADRDQSGDILFDWDVSRWSSGSESSDDDDGDGVQDDEGWDTPESESEGSGGSEGKPEPEVTRETTLAMCLQALTAAVRCMPGLTCFHWLINSKYLQPTDDLFAALLACPVISDVEIFPGEDLSANDYGV